MSDSRILTPLTCRVSPSTTRAGPVMSARAGAVTNRSAARRARQNRDCHEKSQNVRFGWSQADIRATSCNVRFTPKSRH